MKSSSFYLKRAAGLKKGSKKYLNNLNMGVLASFKEQGYKIRKIKSGYSVGGTSTYKIL